MYGDFQVKILSSSIVYSYVPYEFYMSGSIYTSFYRSSNKQGTILELGIMNKVQWTTLNKNCYKYNHPPIKNPDLKTAILIPVKNGEMYSIWKILWLWSVFIIST